MGGDLEQVYEDQDPEFFIRGGMKQGVARVRNLTARSH
jgi:hypothetical protein